MKQPLLNRGMVILCLVSLAALGGAARAGGQDESRDQQVLRSQNIQADFPRLKSDFAVLAPGTRQYNCIAHSLGLNDRWINPMTGPANNPLAPMDALYARRGYVRQQGLNLKLEKGKQKVVLYATLNLDATICKVTHGAVQQKDGSWTSKLGSLALIRHPTPNVLRGRVYGTPVAVYVRLAR